MQKCEYIIKEMERNCLNNTPTITLLVPAPYTFPGCCDELTYNTYAQINMISNHNLYTE